MNNLTASNQQMAWMYLGRGAWGGGSLVAMLPSYISSSQSAYSSHLGLAGLAGKSHQTSFITSDTDNATENMSLKNKVRIFTVDVFYLIQLLNIYSSHTSQSGKDADEKDWGEKNYRAEAPTAVFWFRYLSQI